MSGAENSDIMELLQSIDKKLTDIDDKLDALDDLATSTDVFEVSDIHQKVRFIENTLLEYVEWQKNNPD